MNDKVLVVVMSAVVIVVFSVTMIYVGSYLEKQQSPTLPAKEYVIFGHENDPPLRVYTSQGIFLFQTEEEWNRFELNHTYTCEETYSNVSLSNCTEITSG